jgi:hypothetical protein
LSPSLRFNPKKCSHCLGIDPNPPRDLINLP